MMDVAEESEREDEAVSTGGGGTVDRPVPGVVEIGDPLGERCERVERDSPGPSVPSRTTEMTDARAMRPLHSFSTTQIISTEVRM